MYIDTDKKLVPGWCVHTFSHQMNCFKKARVIGKLSYKLPNVLLVQYRSEIIFHVIDTGTGVPIKPEVVIPKLENHPKLGALLVVDVEVW